jgi:Methyltransferase domain
MIRQFKPKNFVEIGCGQSTLVAQFAFEDCAKDDPAYRCRHVCFEPFENPWLDSLGIQIRRERIERSELALFRGLDANDVVFIDSSHALRPMGDVEFEYLHMLPVLRPGVIVHAHDIFSPRDYPGNGWRSIAVCGQNNTCWRHFYRSIQNSRRCAR